MMAIRYERVAMSDEKPTGGADDAVPGASPGSQTPVTPSTPSPSQWVVNLNAVTLVAISAIVIGINIWALVYVFAHVSSPAKLDSSGVVVLDRFGNAKTVLLATLPFLTTIMGYWFGNRGTADAKADAESARTEAKKATVAKGLAMGALTPAASAQLVKDHPQTFL
jgi:hypothetical protein